MEKNGLFFSGRSMTGTFKEKDYLHITQVHMNDLELGDVIVFRGTNDKNIVHRIICIKGDEIYTRGDYNLFSDHKIMNSSMLIGKVKGYYRGNQFFTISNGYCGRLRALQIRIMLLFKRNVLFLINPFYQLLKRTGVAPLIWKPDLKMVTLNSIKGQKIKFTHRGKTVIVLNDNNIIFRRRPYDLLF